MSDVLSELLSSKVRAAVLRQLLPRPHLAYSLTELAGILRMPISSLQHECYKLERLRILVSQRDGMSRRYQVAPDGPLQPELTSLVVRSLSGDTVLRAAVEGVPGLDACFLVPAVIDGSGGGSPRLVVIGEVALDELAALSSRAETALGLLPGTLDLAYFRPADWRAHLTDGNSFVAALLAAPRTPLVADGRTDIALD